MFIEKIENYKIEGLLLITMDNYHDSRGEIWTLHSENPIFPDFVEDKITISNLGVLRGLHGDPKTCKLISCLHGSFVLNVVDARKGSKTYGESQKFNLSSDKGQSVLVPPGCLNGHLCKSEKCIFWYKWSEKYDISNQTTVSWNDKTLNLDWECENPLLSERDKNGKDFKGVEL